MSTIKRSTKRIGTVVLGLSFYALMIVQCASQTSDSVSVPRAAWERLESAIQGVAEAMRTITSAQKPTPTQKIEPSSQSPPAATGHFQDPDPPITTSQGCVKPDCCDRLRDRDCHERPPNRDCCERPPDRDCCERSRDRDCCEPRRHQGCCEPRRHQGCCEPRRYQGCCEPRRYQGCCEPRRYQGCCEPHRHQGCCEPRRYQGCCEPRRYRGCCEPHRYRGCCEPYRNRDCCETSRREPLVWRAPPCDYCDRWALDEEY